MGLKFPYHEYKDRIWFTADSHFGHENIIKYCDRPFSNSQHMDEMLISRWNKLIKEDDIVFHLGDFTLGNDAEKYLKRLNGKIKILKLFWHHDRRWIGEKNWADGKKHTVNFMEPLIVVYIDGLREDRMLPITISHYPMAEWEASHYGTWHLHGHSHGHHETDPRRPFALDVGVDCWNYYPVSLNRICETMFELGWQK